MREPFIDFIKKELKPKTVLIGCGLPASGKTTAIRVIAELKGYEILSTDLIRLDLFKNEDIFDEKVASDMDKRTLVYDEMFTKADELTGKGQGTILDGTFITRKLRRRAAGVAARHGMTFVIQQTQCPDEICLRRISQRVKENYESNAITEQAYFNNRKKFEPIDLEDLKSVYPDLDIVHFIVDTTSDSSEQWFVIRVTREKA